MCQAIPRRVLHVADERAEVLYDGEPQWIAIQGIADVQVGDYLVVYAGQALDRIPTDEAEEMLRFYAELEGMLDEAIGSRHAPIARGEEQQQGGARSQTR